MSDHGEALEALKQLRNEMAQEAETSMYGFFPGGDPRNFSPDEESATPAELKNHQKACAEWNAGKQESRPDCTHIIDGQPTPEQLNDPQFSSGTITPHGSRITLCQFGLGVYTITDERLVAWVDELNAIVGQLERDE